MSKQNVERWRTHIEAFLENSQASDWEVWISKTSELYNPEIEWDASAIPIPGLSGKYHGKDGVGQFWREWLGAWETSKFEYKLLDAGDRVVLLLDQSMRGRSTGIEVQLGRYAQVATFSKGLMVHWRAYPSQSEALEAAGLSGQ